MKIEHVKYNFKRSVRAIDHILRGADNEYRDIRRVPAESSLSFKNGFYVDVTVLFVDIRGSKELADSHTKPVLAKIYRSYISEVIAAMKGNEAISDVFIEGDGLWAVFNTKNKDDLGGIVSTAAEISSLVDILNMKLEKKKYSTIEIGIGIDKGELLCIKAGNYGSRVNEIVWIGKTVGEASRLCNYGNKEELDKQIMISEKIYLALSDYLQGFFDWSHHRQCYHGSIYKKEMSKWIEESM